MSDEKRFDGKTEVKLADAVLTRGEEDLKGLNDTVVVEKRIAFGGGIHSKDDDKQKKDGKRKDHDCHCEEWVCDDVLCETEFPCDCDPVKSGLTDVVDSVAHQENGLAKILESESKKICKAIGIARSIEDLIKVDKSVQDTIKQINQVQIVLISKLQEVSDICDGCVDDCGCRD